MKVHVDVHAFNSSEAARGLGNHKSVVPFERPDMLPKNEPYFSSSLGATFTIPLGSYSNRPPLPLKAQTARR